MTREERIAQIFAKIAHRIVKKRKGPANPHHPCIIQIL